MQSRVAERGVFDHEVQRDWPRATATDELARRVKAGRIRSILRSSAHDADSQSQRDDAQLGQVRSIEQPKREWRRFAA